MRKRLALIMAAVLVLGGPAQSMNSGAAAFAAQSGKDGLLTKNDDMTASSSNGENQTVWPEEIKTSDSASAVSEETESGTGWLRLQVEGVTRAAQTEWTVELHPAGDGKNGKTVEEKLILPAVKNHEFSQAQLVIRDIPNGTYDLLLFPSDTDKSPYMAYEQSVTVESDLTVLRFMDDLPESYYEGQKDQTQKIGRASCRERV